MTVIQTKIRISRLQRLNFKKATNFYFELVEILFRCLEEIPTFVGMTGFFFRL